MKQEAPDNQLPMPDLVRSTPAFLHAFRTGNEMSQLHDHTLESITVNWPARRIQIHISGASEGTEILASGFIALNVPRHEGWGPSVSIYNVTPPEQQPDGKYKLGIKMQSGDVITVIANLITLRTQAK
jgi:hypothetical protein